MSKGNDVTDNDDCHSNMPDKVRIIMEGKWCPCCATLNRENTCGCFPRNQWNIWVSSDDGGIPYLHVRRNKWDLCFLIEDGTLLYTNTYGQDQEDYEYAVNNIAIWLEHKSSKNETMTNREYALHEWKSVHETGGSYL